MVTFSNHPQGKSSWEHRHVFFVTVCDMTKKPTPGERFRQFRKHLGLSGQALGRQLGVSKTAISYWETNHVALSKPVCNLLEQLHHVSAAWLLDGTGSMWLPTPPPTLPEAPDLVLRPLLPEKDAFRADGSVMTPWEHAPSLGLPCELVARLLDECQGGAPEDLFFIQIHGHELEPTLFPEDWALVHTGLAVRETIVDHSLYLVRLVPGDAPQVRRLAIDPHSLDLLVGVDAQTRVPIRIRVPATDRPAMILGKVCWIGGRR